MGAAAGLGAGSGTALGAGSGAELGAANLGAVSGAAATCASFSSVLAPVLAKCHKDKRVRMAIDVDPLNLF